MADVLGSAGRRIRDGCVWGVIRCRTERDDPLTQRTGNSLLIGAAGAGRTQDFDRVGRAEGHGNLTKPGDAMPPGQRLECAADVGWHGRRPAAQQQPDAGQETLQPAVGRTPALGEPDLRMACLQHPPGAFERRAGMVRIDREEVLKLDRTSLPPDAQFKGYEDVVVQELRVSTDNVKFRKEKYYAPSTGQTYLAPLPAGYRGEFGPNLKSLCLLFSHLCNMTEPKIADLLENFGIAISSGQISAWLTGAYPGIQEEKRAIVEAGLASSPWQHMDDTGTRVNGENHHCQILCNPLYGAYFTTAHKDRLTIIDVLRNGRRIESARNFHDADLARLIRIAEAE